LRNIGIAPHSEHGDEAAAFPSFLYSSCRRFFSDCYTREWCLLRAIGIRHETGQAMVAPMDLY
jgi:hypothetical protein